MQITTMESHRRNTYPTEDIGATESALNDPSSRSRLSASMASPAASNAVSSGCSDNRNVLYAAGPIARKLRPEMRNTPTAGSDATITYTAARARKRIDRHCVIPSCVRNNPNSFMRPRFRAAPTPRRKLLRARWPARRAT